MKTIKLTPILLTALLFCSFTAIGQKDENNLDTIEDAYLGMEDDYYTFSYLEYGDENVLSFDKIISI